MNKKQADKTKTNPNDDSMNWRHRCENKKHRRYDRKELAAIQMGLQ